MTPIPEPEITGIEWVADKTFVLCRKQSLYKAIITLLILLSNYMYEVSFADGKD